MDGAEFRRRGKEMIDYVADYLENIQERRVFPTVEPGYLHQLIPDHAPEEGEKWDDLFKDIERVIMPGVTHWNHPQFHAYFPSANSYPAMCADILCDAIGCLGFTWASSPACTELEVVMMDWLAKLLNLPEQFLSGGKGGGVIQGTASEATFVALLAARQKAIQDYRHNHPEIKNGEEVADKLVAYCSDNSHVSVERAGLLGRVKIVQLPADDKQSLRGDTLQEAINKDKSMGLIPCFVCATLGTTSSCAFDNIKELGPICEKEGIWMHVDAAYAGSAFICPEYRYLLDGVEHAMSFDFNPHKWLMVNFDCSAMWLKDSSYVVDAFNVDAAFLKTGGNDIKKTMPDFRHWQIPFGRRFRSLKLWFVLRLYGVRALQDIIRKQIALAHEFEGLVVKDGRFEIVAEVIMGLVCFRMKGPNEPNEKLLELINKNGRIHLVPGKIKSTYFIRFAVCAKSTESKDIAYAWSVIAELATRIISENKR
ncbi:unnamed protein product [Owenia fusiformis]|uniref:Aromatic-L-amino-acid decarboxylase n=1 Tax=Owenia fusiformis TaxID=6347 RepID=A0A8S4PFT2_OWEFU|nr:unnamed protein product [Owenia fusiformis]